MGGSALAFLIVLAFIAVGIALVLTVVANDIRDFLRNLDVYDGPHCRECGIQLPAEYRLGMCSDCEAWYRYTTGDQIEEAAAE